MFCNVLLLSLFVAWCVVMCFVFFVFFNAIWFVFVFCVFSWILFVKKCCFVIGLGLLDLKLGVFDAWFGCVCCVLAVCVCFKKLGLCVWLFNWPAWFKCCLFVVLNWACLVRLCLIWLVCFKIDSVCLLGLIVFELVRCVIKLVWLCVVVF